MRDPAQDNLAAMIAAIDQHTAMAHHFGEVWHAEWQACVTAGMDSISAAVLVGTRYSTAGASS